MAPRKLVKWNNSTRATFNKYDSLGTSDVICAICKSILIEPVSLPCKHTFCSSCFDATIANLNLVCPLCRVRIGSWLRRANKTNTLVDTMLWEAIQCRFSQQVKNKLNGIEDEEFPLSDKPVISEAAPGEIRREYELEKAKREMEFEKQRQIEVEASEAYIRKLKVIEAYEETVNEENIRMSERVAKQLTEEMMTTVGEAGPSTSKPNNDKRSRRTHGPLDKFVDRIGNDYNVRSLRTDPTANPDRCGRSKFFTCRIMCQGGGGGNEALSKFPMYSSSSTTTSGDSNDSIDVECRYFKPIEHKYNYIPMAATVAANKVPISKVGTAFVTANGNSKVVGRPPSGKSSFVHSSGSAFARVRPRTDEDDDDDSALTGNNNSSSSNVPRCGQTRKRKCRYSQTEQQKPSSSSKRRSISLLRERASPPFRGFGRDRETGVKKQSKSLQESADFKYARQLHEKLNGGRYPRTRNRTQR